MCWTSDARQLSPGRAILDRAAAVLWRPEVDATTRLLCHAGLGGRCVESVLINGPFDDDDWPIFDAIPCAVIACGFDPRDAAEVVDSGTIRLQTMGRIRGGCRYGIHDVSRIELSSGCRGSTGHLT